MFYCARFVFVLLISFFSMDFVENMTNQQAKFMNVKRKSMYAHFAT